MEDSRPRPHQLQLPRQGMGQPEPRRRPLRPSHPWFPAPRGTHSSRCLFPEDGIGPETESVLAAVTQQGGARPRVQPWHSLFSKQWGVESCVCPSSVPSPCLYFIFRSRGGGRECRAARPPAVPGRASFIPQTCAAAAALRTDGLQLMRLLAPLTLESLPGIKAGAQPAGAGLSLSRWCRGAWLGITVP